jgi:hypothetical protein
MKRPAGPFLILVIGALGWAQPSAGAETFVRGHRPELIQAGLTAEEEERDAREIADRVNEAVNIRREVTIILHNDTTLTMAPASRMTARRTWLIISNSDGSEIRFRVSLIATVQIK